MSNNLVCYLFTRFDNKKSIFEFIKYYKKYSSGVKHTLLICFKLLSQQKINSLKKSFKNVNYIEFIDKSTLNDYDFGSYKRVAESYPKCNILFLNSHSYPLHNLWFKKLLNHFDKNTLIGTTASNESLLSSIVFPFSHEGKLSCITLTFVTKFFATSCLVAITNTL